MSEEPYAEAIARASGVIDAIVEEACEAAADWQFHTYRPMENPPRIIVRDADGNVTYETLDPPLIVWEPVGPVPTMTVTVKCSDEWTELGT